MTNYEKWQYFTRDVESPQLMVDWTFYFMVTATLGRRVWWGDAEFTRYPNIYLVFVGPSALGKTIAASKGAEPVLTSLQKKHPTQKDAEGLPKLTDAVKLSADATTLEKLYDDIECAIETDTDPETKTKYAHSSITFLLGDEMGLLFKQNLNDLVNFLNSGYDCKKRFKYRTRHQKNTDIHNMCINLLGCCTPDWLRRNFQSGLLNEGFGSRLIFVYGHEKRQRTSRIYVNDDQRKALNEIRSHLARVSKTIGRLTFSPEAEAWWDRWWLEEKPEVIRENEHPVLNNYYGRIREHLFKTAVAVHFSEHTTMEIEKKDLEKARELLTNTEKLMHMPFQTGITNTTSTLADNLKHEIKTQGTMSYRKVLLSFINTADQMQIDDALRFLGTTGQILPNPAELAPEGLRKSEFRVVR